MAYLLDGINIIQNWGLTWSFMGSQHKCKDFYISDNYGNGDAQESLLLIYFFKDFFFDVDHFESLYQICYIITSVYILFFWHVGILAPQPGIEPITLALEGEVLTTGPPGMSHVPF